MKKLIVILGPTSTGKTDLALSIAKKFNGELVSTDSRQLYKGLDIGTGKLPNEDSQIKKGQGFWEINKIKIWMYDLVDPKIQYNVADYVKEASKVIEKIGQGGKLPIIVGGTGLYIKALLEGLDSLSTPVDKKLRKKLQKLTKEQLQKKLQTVSVKRWENMNYSDQQNPRRLIRAIEIHSNSKFKIQRSKLQFKVQNYSILKIGLTAKRDILYHKSDERVLSRMKQGMIKEAMELRKHGVSLERMRQLGLEYGVLADFLDGRIKREEELVGTLKNKIHGYIRRQQTWFSKEKNVFWFDISGDYLDKMEKMVSDWYNQR